MIERRCPRVLWSPRRHRSWCPGARVAEPASGPEDDLRRTGFSRLHELMAPLLERRRSRASAATGPAPALPTGQRTSARASQANEAPRPPA